MRSNRENAKQQLGRWITSAGLFFCARRDWLLGKLGLSTSGHLLRQHAAGNSQAASGIAGERLAEKFLRRKGYRILDRGHKQRRGEIDLIALDGQQIVFVEVKARASLASGDPGEAVDFRKQQRLTRAALIYLKKRQLLDQPARFDVVSILWPQAGQSQPTIRHFENAFEATGIGQLYS